MRDRLGGIIGMFSLCAMIAAAAPAAAQTPSLQDGMTSCMHVIGAMERLACYDRFAQTMTGAGTPARPAAVNTAPTKPGSDATVQFGSENLPRASAAASGRIDAVTSQIQKFDVSPGGQFVVLLANGQTWRQMDGDHTAARFHPGSTRAVTIKRGAFGSYNLTFNDRSIEFKVMRIN